MKNKVIKMVSCIIFLTLITKMTVFATYLFRNVGSDRLNIIGMYEEGPLDIVYIGGSSTFVYWQALKAWNDCGFTSYAYATNSLKADGSIYYMKEVLKSHKPKMFVIETRNFIEPELEIEELAIRAGADSMDLFSINRWRYVQNYITSRNLNE